MRGLKLFGLLTLLGGSKPLLDGVPTAETRPSVELLARAESSQPVAGGPLARQGRGAGSSSPQLGPSVECTGIVVHADPKVDVGMAREAAGNPDAEMVIASPCRR